MEPEDSLPYSQVPATCPCPEPARSSPYLHIPLPGDPSYYYPPIYSWFSQVFFFLQVFLPKPCTRLSSPPYALHAPPISFFSILSPEQYWASITIIKFLITYDYDTSPIISRNPVYTDSMLSAFKEGQTD